MNMPTQEAFEQAAIRFDTAADEVDGLLPPIRAADRDDVLAGSQLAASVDTIIDESNTELRIVSTDLRELAEESRRRARETAAAAAAAARFAEQQDRFEQEQAEFDQGDGTGEPPTPPTPPPAPPAFADF